MAQEDIKALWKFFLQDINQCIGLERLDTTNEDILREKTNQAYLSAVHDTLENVLAELANTETSLACNKSTETTSALIKAKSQFGFIKKLQTIKAKLAEKAATNCFLTHEVQNLFLIMNQVLQLEQLESNNETLEIFAYIFIASLVPILSSCASSSSNKHQNDIEQLKTVMHLQSAGSSKRKESSFILLNSIIEALTLIEKSNNVLSKMLKDQEEAHHQGLEAISSCIKLISTHLQNNIRLSHQPGILNHVTAEKQPTEANDKNHSIKSSMSNVFFHRAATSLKTAIQHYTDASPVLEIQQKKSNSKKDFFFLHRIEDNIRKELIKNTKNICQLTLAKLFSDYAFMKHIKGLRYVLFLQAGTVMEQFSSEIVCKIDATTKWNQESWLTLSLHNCMSNGHLTWFCNYLSVKLGSNSLVLNETGPLPELTINYAAPWPVSDIVQQDSLELYNKVFKFLFNIKCNLVTLQRLSFKDLGSPAADHNRLFWLRNWMIFFLSSVFTYFVECVLEPSYATFDFKALRCNHMEELALLHQEYIRDIHHGCFLDQGSEFINQPIREITNYTHDIVASWNGFSADIVVQELEKKFVYRYGYVVSVLNSPVCRSSFQHVETLGSSLNYKYPAIFGKAN